jgi:hypothetical protein
MFCWTVLVAGSLQCLVTHSRGGCTTINVAGPGVSKVLEVELFRRLNKPVVG